MNNTTQHTPAPWEIGNEHPDTGEIRILSKKDYVCIVLRHPDDEATPDDNAQQAKANARLITAAPELLKALTYCEFAMEHGTTEDQEYACKQARTAITKARGE